VEQEAAEVALVEVVEAAPVELGWVEAAVVVYFEVQIF
jgi:hypothetical protein